MADKFKYSRLVSPIGLFDLTWAMKPSKKYKSEEEEYKTNFIFDDTPENRKWCEDLMTKAVAEAKEAGVKLKKVYKSPFTFPEDLDEDDFLPSGDNDRPKYDPDIYQDKIFFTTKSRYQPGLIDRNREPLTEPMKIFGGDTGRVKVEINPYEGFGGGISLRWVTAQLIAKKEGFNRGPDTEGFDEVGDEYPEDF